MTGFLDALRAEGMANVEPILERVETAEDAERLRFVGSPTILVDPAAEPLVHAATGASAGRRSLR